jgi:hypothetical protein
MLNIEIHFNDDDSISQGTTDSIPTSRGCSFHIHDLDKYDFVKKWLNEYN